MVFVVDASVAACWLFPDEAHPVAARAWLLIHEEEALVPGHWWFEIRNTLLIGERRGRVDARYTTFAVKRLAEMTIQTAPYPHDADVFDLARKYRLTFYDAAYLELARREGLALATLDRALANATRAEHVQLISDSS